MPSAGTGQEALSIRDADRRQQHLFTKDFVQRRFPGWSMRAAVREQAPPACGPSLSAAQPETAIRSDPERRRRRHRSRKNFLQHADFGPVGARLRLRRVQGASSSMCGLSAGRARSTCASPRPRAGPCRQPHRYENRPQRRLAMWLCRCFEMQRSQLNRERWSRLHQPKSCSTSVRRLKFREFVPSV